MRHVDEHSVTAWVANVRGGDEAALARSWDRFFHRIRALAEHRLFAETPGVDAKDMALSAFNVFVSSLGSGQFPDISERDELWRLLVTITLRKANRELTKSRALKRGGGAAVAPLDVSEIAAEQTTMSQVMLNDECTRLLEMLGNDEIAVNLGSTRRAIQRMSALIGLGKQVCPG